MARKSRMTLKAIKGMKAKEIIKKKKKKKRKTDSWKQMVWQTLGETRML